MADTEEKSCSPCAEGGREKVKKWGTSSLLYTVQPRERFSRLVLERGFLSSQGKGKAHGRWARTWVGSHEGLDEFFALKIQSLCSQCTTYTHVHVLPPKSPPCSVQFFPQHFHVVSLLFACVPHPCIPSTWLCQPNTQDVSGTNH